MGEHLAGDPYGYTRSKSILGSSKLKILAGIVTFIVIILIMSESVVIVQAGHRGVVLYVGAVENRVLGEGFIHSPVCRTGNTDGGTVRSSSKLMHQLLQIICKR